jgi:CDP-diacylglycerol--glycerol-3-phosphate 3-phosphatidyltransferase
VEHRSTWKRRLRWLPNAITLTRLAGIPVLIWLMIQADAKTSTSAAVVYTVIAGTDFIDGILARILGAESRFGRIADPLCDRLLIATVLIGLVAMGRQGWPGPTTILVRDLTLMLAFILLATRGGAGRVDWAGKTASAVTMVGAGMCLLNEWPGGDIVFLIAIILSLVTFANYAVQAILKLRVSGST